MAPKFNTCARRALTRIGLVAVTLAYTGAAFAQEAAAVVDEESQFGLGPALKQGGFIAQATFGLMVLMSVGSWYIMITKYLEQRTIMNQAKELDKKFWNANSISEGAGKLSKNSAFKQIVDDGLRAAAHHDGKLTDKIDQHEWITMSLQRATDAIASKLQNHLAFLATVGSTAPFVGLFGTVVGIYNALLKIAAAGQATIDKVAGPVGEALIMTAIGLFVAVPAVMGYNLLIRRNKSVIERLGNFSNDVHAFLLSGARVAGK
jgi:biopolymer transport protein ExbB